MKVIHIESGLGNQMLGYLEYVAIKANNPNDDCYIETIIYEIPEANEVICQWRGYELDKIFGLNPRNIKEIFTNDEWNAVIADVKESKFWENGWNYPNAICNALNSTQKVKLINICRSNKKWDEGGLIRRKVSAFFQTNMGYHIRRILIKYLFEKKIRNKFAHPNRLFFSDERDLYCGFTLLFNYCGNNIEKLIPSPRDMFCFQNYNDDLNRKTCLYIRTVESVAIHIRRGDALYSNKKYYNGGYYKRAVKMIRKRVKEPIFVVFSDPDSRKWVSENYKKLGLNKRDKIIYVDWNCEENSYRDIQLMSECKHAIIGRSSFAWWGAYLIKNPQKITISPEVYINTLMHC